VYLELSLQTPVMQIPVSRISISQVDNLNAPDLPSVLVTLHDYSERIREAIMKNSCFWGYLLLENHSCACENLKVKPVLVCIMHNIARGTLSPGKFQVLWEECSQFLIVLNNFTWLLLLFGRPGKIINLISSAAFIIIFVSRL